MNLKSITFLLLLMIFPWSKSTAALEIGAAIPEVRATLDSGETISLPEYATQQYLLVYFYPKADTPGCTKQACSLRDAYEVLLDQGVTVLGVSKDSRESQQAFKQKYGLPFSLVADSESKVINAFKVPKKLGFASRQAFLFKNGKLVWKDLAASTTEQADDVLDFLKENSQDSQ